MTLTSVWDLVMLFSISLYVPLLILVCVSMEPYQLTCAPHIIMMLESLVLVSRLDVYTKFIVYSL